ncbi:EIF3C-like protein, partial [Mya arenaria]
YDDLKNIIKDLKNKKKIKDLSNVLTEFESLLKAYDKAKKVVEKEGIPRFYIRTLVELEDFVTECWEDREGRKKLNKSHAKSLTTLRQKLKKYARDFESEMESAVDDDDEDEWSQSESDSEEDEDAPTDYTNMAAYFLKEKTSDDKKETKAQKKLKRQLVKKDADKDEDEGEWEEVTGKGGVPMVVKLYEITAARGKKGTDRQEQIELLKELYSIAEANKLGYAMSVKITFNITAAIYDYNPNIATCMKSDMWDICVDGVKTLLGMLKEHSDITVGANITEDTESLEKSPFLVRGCILTVVERMCEEYTKMLQACDAHSTEYVERLRDDVKVCAIVDELVNYLEGRATSEEICRAYLRKTNQCTEADMDVLCKFIYTNDSTDRLRTRAILCQIYHHALHDRWFQARDLMLMSHLQDNSHHSDVPT